jgi:hypothetical protein
MNFSHAPSEIAAPLDFKTDTLMGTAEYRQRNWNAGARVAHSSFDNEHESLRWDNQLFLTDVAVSPTTANPGRMQMSQAVDSGSDLISLFGGVQLRGRTRIDASLSQATTTQDEAFLPMTINSLLTPTPLPAGDYDGEHRNTTARLLVTSRPTRDLRFSAWYRSYELDNRSPSLVFDDYVQTDYTIPLCSNVNACDENGNGIADDPIARRSLPYGYHNQYAGALVGWTPLDWLQGSLSFERVGVDREFSAVESSDEDIWKLMLDFDVSAWLSARATFWQQEREAEHYEAHYYEESFPTGEPNVAAFNEGTRRFNWTDRDRTSAALMLDAAPSERVSVFAEAVFADNDYTDPNTGLAIGDSYTVEEDRDFDGTPETYDIRLAGRTDDQSTSYSVGFAVSPSAKWNVYGYYTWETWEYGL